MKKANASKKLKTPIRSDDVPVTQRMLYLVRDELKSDFRSIEHRLDQLESKMDMKFEKLTSEVHRIGLLVEEQNARNRIVLDAITALIDRQERCENRFTHLRKHGLDLGD